MVVDAGEDDKPGIRIEYTVRKVRVESSNVMLNT